MSLCRPDRRKAAPYPAWGGICPLGMMAQASRYEETRALARQFVFGEVAGRTSGIMITGTPACGTTPRGIIPQSSPADLEKDVMMSGSDARGGLGAMTAASERRLLTCRAC